MGQALTGKQTRAAWSDYWDLDGASEQRAVGGVQHKAVFQQFWQSKLSEEFRARSRMRVLDAACGDGAVTRQCIKISQHHPDCALDMHATDCSHRALAEIDALDLPVEPRLVVADACELPFAPGTFDCVLSQCGLEYAGLEAFESAARLVAEGGRLLAVIHHEKGLIHQECAGHLELLTAVGQSGVLEEGKALFELQRLSDSGALAPEAVDDAAAELGQHIGELSASLASQPLGPARHHVQHVIADFSVLCARHAAYEPDQARQWLDHHHADLAGFRTRMESMSAAAQSEADLDGLVANLKQAGLGEVEASILRAADVDQPLAWTVSATA